MIECSGITLMSDKEVICHYDRTLLDLGFLERMAQGCKSGSPAHSHYVGRLHKERRLLDLLKEQMEERELFS